MHVHRSSCDSACMVVLWWQARANVHPPFWIEQSTFTESVTSLDLATLNRVQ